MAIFDTSDIQTTGLTVNGVTVLSGNSSATILIVSGLSGANFSIIDSGVRFHNYLYDSTNTTGTTGQVLTTTSTGVKWSAFTPTTGIVTSGSVISSTIRCGVTNTASGLFSASFGGSANTASAVYSLVLGGKCNISSNSGSTIGGGLSNSSSGVRSSIIGGCSNYTQGCNSFIGGGNCNIISGTSASFGFGSVIFAGLGTNTYSGTFNIASGPASASFTVSPNICTSGNFATSSSGFFSTSTGDYSVRGAGYVASSYHNFSTTYSGDYIGGGQYAVTMAGHGSGSEGCFSIAGGGQNNSHSSNFSIVMGGVQSTLHPLASCFLSVGSAANSDASSQFLTAFNLSRSSVGSIFGTLLNNRCSTICTGCYCYGCGGCQNMGASNGSGAGLNMSGGTWDLITCCFTVAPSIVPTECSSFYTTFFSGVQNVVQSDRGFIGNGLCNFLYNQNCAQCSFGSSIVTGFGNNTTGGSCVSTGFTSTPTFINSCCHSFVGSGFQNVTTGNHSAIITGSGNTVSGSFSGAFGCGLYGSGACTFYVNNLCGCGSLYTSAIATGRSVCITTNGQMVGFQGGAGSSGSSGASSAVNSMPAVVVSTTSQSASNNTVYVSNNASLVTVTLPTTSLVGTIIEVTGLGVGGWQIAQNSGQSIQFGVAVTTVGVGGYLQSTITYDTVRLLCIVDSTTWMVLSSQGNITYV